jgi:hypothetical protein
MGPMGVFGSGEMELQNVGRVVGGSSILDGCRMRVSTVHNGHYSI